MRPPFVEYDRRSSPALATVLDTNYQQMVASDQRLVRIFPNIHKTALKRGKNIKDLLWMNYLLYLLIGLYLYFRS